MRFVERSVPGCRSIGKTSFVPWWTKTSVGCSTCVVAKLADLTGTTIGLIEGLIARYGEQYPRRTRAMDFDTIKKKAVAQPTIKLVYDADTGFFGSQVKTGRRELLASEYDLILGIMNDGSYRIMTPPEKLLMPGKLLYLELFDPDVGAEFTVVYRDHTKHAFGKRVRIQKFIRNREYLLIKDKAGRIDLLLPGHAKGSLSLEYVKTPRQRVRAGSFKLSKLEPMGVGARGVRLAPKAVSRVKWKREQSKRTRSAKPARQTSLF